MADLTITIPLPILSTGQYFKTRYRSYPSGTWSGYTNRSNLPFTITGLSAGEYEFEFILVNADSSECVATYRKYTVEEDYQCITFSSQMKEVNGMYHIEVTYTLPGGHTDPSCGWEIEYIQNSSSKFTLPALPVSGIIKIPVPNQSTVLYIRANMCNGRKKDCHSADVSPVADPPCLNISNVQASIVETIVGNTCEYHLHITFNQSTPPTTKPVLHYKQWRTYGPSGLHDLFNGTLTISPTATKIIKKLNPYLFAGEEEMDYRINLTDGCGGTTSQRVQFFREKCFDEKP